MTSSPRPSSTRPPRILWLIAGLFILYAATIPFDFVTDPTVVGSHLARVQLNPFISPDTGRRISGPDFVVNVFFFVPFGALGVWALRGPRTKVARILTAVACAMFLSVGVETLQLFTVNRVSSAADVLANTMGAFIGAVAWVTCEGAAKASLARLSAAGLTQTQSFYPLMVAVIVVVVAAWEPFDASLDVSLIRSKLRGFRVDPWQFTIVSDEGLSFLRYVLLTTFAATWLRELGVRSAALFAFLCAATAGVSLEASQLFIDSRMPGVEDALVTVAGAVAGTAAFRLVQFNPRPWLVWSAVAAATAIGATMQQLTPFTFTGDYRPFQWVPFLNYYEVTTMATVSHLIELPLMYFPLGFATSWIVRKRWHAEVFAIAATLAIAAPLEYLQCWIGGRYPDVTDVAISVAGGWLGAWVGREGWDRFRRRSSVSLQVLDDVPCFRRRFEPRIEGERPLQ